MIRRRPTALVTLLLSTAVVAGDARAGRVDWHGKAGVVMPKGIESFTARPTLGADVTKVWSPRAHLDLGLELGAVMTTFPYGQTDGPGMIRYVDNAQESFTLLPHLAFGPRFLPRRNVSLGVALGATWMWSGPSGALVIVPYPTASAAIETWLGPDERLGLRAGFSYMHYWFGNGNDLMRNALLEPSLSFVWTPDRAPARDGHRASRDATGMPAAAPGPSAETPPPMPTPSPVRGKLGLDLGLQVGFALPFGRINGNIALVLNDVVSSMVPIVAEASYHVADSTSVGLLFRYGVLQFRDAGEACGPGANCRGSTTAAAAHVTLHAPVPWRVVPWLRLGGGYEWFRMQLTGDFMGAPADLSLRFRGLMFGLAELGTESTVLPWLAVGPVVSLSVGRYNLGTDGGAPEMSLVYKRVHEWLMFGVRGVFRI